MKPSSAPEIPAILLKAERLNEEISLHGKASDFEALLGLAPEVEALLRTLNGELFARAALALLKPFARTGRLGEAQVLFHQALAHADAPDTLAWLRIRLAELDTASGEPSSALQKLSTTKPASLNTQLAFAYAKGTALREAGEFEAAVVELDAALQLAEAAGNHRARIHMLNARAGIEIRRGFCKDSAPFYEQALHLSRRYNPDLCDAVMSNLAAAQLESRNYTRAIELFESIMESATVTHDDQVIASGNLALAYALAGRFEAAETTNRRVNEMMKAGFWKGGTAIRHLVAGILALNLDDSKARTAFQDLVRTGELENQPGFMKVGRQALAAMDDDFDQYEQQAIISRAAWQAMQNETMSESMNAFEAKLIARFVSKFAVRKDLTAFQIGSGDWVDLRRRGPARRILQVLVDAYPNAVDAWVLFEAAWPEVRVTDPAMMSKLYTTIHRLRELGLAEVIDTRGEGYVLTLQPILA